MYRRLLIHAFCGLFFLLPLVGSAQIYVSTTGDDAWPGDHDHPKATLPSALRLARENKRLNPLTTLNGIHIILQGGTYFLDEPILLRPEDAGSMGYPTIIESAAGTKAILSGGMPVSNWRKSKDNIPGLSGSAKGKIWEADIPVNKIFRQFWVNDQKAIRAKDANGSLMNRILSWNKTEQTCWIPTPKADLQNVKGLEMLIHQWWEIAILRIKNFEVHGDSTKLSFYQPESRIQSEHPWPAPWISKETGNSAFYLVNALQLLDEPGEWYADAAAGKLYYWPMQDENMQTASAVLSNLETLVKATGTVEQSLNNIQFKNISFQHTAFLRPSLMGHVPLQAGMYLLDAYKLKPAGTPLNDKLENQAWVGRPPAAVAVSYAGSFTFCNCSFEHLASTGLDIGKATHQVEVTGSLFKDIGGSGILAGTFSDEAIEVHLPYYPWDHKEICSNIQINNNLLTDIANEDWGCVGIGTGYTEGVFIRHNELEDLSYTGISVGWGWTKQPNAMNNNKVFANRITHYAKHNYDVAGIYTLSAQPGTVISENVIDSIYKAPYAHIPSHWFYLYTDEGSSYITVKDNWCPAEKFLQNANGPGNEWSNNGPGVSAAIKQNAGLQKDYSYLLKEKSIPSKEMEINRLKPVVVELVFGAGEAVDSSKLNEVLNRSRVKPGSLYQWKNHYVIYDKVQDLFGLKSGLANAFPSALVKTYEDPLYDFNRSYCNDKQVAKQWDHVLLTANLVADEKMQQEYMDYHATQFEKWPDIARGFCNADFQQLLVFRNGRQLMLVISIPKGESLDKLNPKTTENNPKMDEWNAIMKKYQEGIEGTKKGETWVFLTKVY